VASEDDVAGEATEEAAWREGVRVRVAGLTSEPTLNGQQGNLTGARQNGREQVRSPVRPIRPTEAKGTAIGPPPWPWGAPPWCPTMGPRHGTPPWDPAMGPCHEGSTPWDPTMGPRHGAPP
jgi:hypothetical protein